MKNKQKKRLMTPKLPNQWELKFFILSLKKKKLLEFPCGPLAIWFNLVCPSNK